MRNNRRKYTRINSEPTPCTVELAGREVQGIVFNESIEGLRIGGLQIFTLSLDQKVTLEYKGEVVSGRCRSISRSQDGTFCVGIFRIDETYTYEHSSFLLNTFMRCARLKVACEVEPTPSIGQHDDEITIRLADGKAFVLDQTRVVCRTRGERALELIEIEEEPEFAEIAAIYSSMTDQEDFSQIDSILDQEFGKSGINSSCFA